MKLAERMSHLGTETAFEVLARAKALEAEGRNIIHLEIGEPDFDTPANIVRAGKDALDNSYTHYGPSAGLPEFRKVIAETVGKARGVDFAMEEVVVTPGAKPIMFFTIFALVNPGDEVIMPNPGFPIYESVVNFVGAKSVPLVLREENEFSFDPDELEKLITPKTKLFVLNSPQNPTGGLVGKAELERVAELAEKHDFYILADEIYKDIIYDESFVSITTLPGMKQRTIILDGLSKTYAMTGWRLGYGIMPPALAEQVAKLQTNSTSCTAAFTQIAGIEALQGNQDGARMMFGEFKKRRDVIVDGLNQLPGFKCLKPKGAFYVFPNIKDVPLSSRELEHYLLNEAGVASLSGTSFGRYGDGYLRFSYANSIENIREALGRMQTALDKL